MRQGWRIVVIGLCVFGFAAAVLAVSGGKPGPVLLHMAKGSLGSWSKAAQVVNSWIPLVLCSAGLLFTFRIGLWNIGVEGQVGMGAVLATWVLRSGMESAHPGFYIAAAFAAGALGGGLWAVFAGVLKTRGDVNEIFAGLGLNFVAQACILWLIFGPWRRPGVASMSGTAPFPLDLWLYRIPSLRLSPNALVLAVLAIIATAVLLGRTRPGLCLRAVGENPAAALLLGLRPGRWMLLSMLLAGALAGLAGAFQTAGVYHRLIPSISSNYGYTALLVAMLAGYDIRFVPFVAFFFACLNVGSIQLPMALNLDSSFAGVLQGALVLGVLAAAGWRGKAGAGKSGKGGAP